MDDKTIQNLQTQMSMNKTGEIKMSNLCQWLSHAAGLQTGTSLGKTAQ